jgi:hypothetical protein
MIKLSLFLFFFAAAFLREVHETIVRGVAENLPMDTIHLEINGLKFQGNHTLYDCCIAVMQSVMTLTDLKNDRKVDVPVIKQVKRE